MSGKLTVSNSEFTVTVYYDNADTNLSHTCRGLPMLRLFDPKGKQVAVVSPPSDVTTDEQRESYMARIKKILDHKPGE